MSTLNINDIFEIKTMLSSSTNAPAWQISMRTYNQIRYWGHLAKNPLPGRKLRKCYLRKHYKRCKQAQAKYFATPKVSFRL